MKFRILTEINLSDFFFNVGPNIRPINQNGGPLHGLLPPPGSLPPPPPGHPNFMNLRPPNMPPNMPQRLFHQHPSRQQDLWPGAIRPPTHSALEACKISPKPR